MSAAFSIRKLAVLVALGFSAAVGLVLVLAGAGLARETGSSSRVAALGDAPSQEPLAVFSRPRTARDVLPAGVAANAIRDLPGGPELPEELRNGSLELANSRLLLSGLGSTGADLYAFTTSKGYVCAVFTTAGGGCTSYGTFTREQPVDVGRWDPDGLGRGVPVATGGLVPNNVVAVDVVVEGTAYPALVRNNAFFLETPSATAQPEAVRVTFESGGTTTISLPPIPTR